MNILPFEFQGCEVRSFEENGVAYFVARDVAVFLQYERPQNAVSAHCKGALKRCIPTAGGDQVMTVIPERDVYRLIMRSKMPRAEEFEEFIMGTVVPQVVRTGKYIPQELSRLELIELARDAEIGRLKAVQELALVAPKVEAFDQFIQSTETQHVGVVGKLFGIGEKTFFTMLRGEGILIRKTTSDYRTRHYNLPRQEYIDAGYFEVDESPIGIEHRDGSREFINKATTKFTPRGIEWIRKRIEKMKERYANGAYEWAA